MNRRLTTLLTFAVFACLAPSALAADGIEARTLYNNGPSGRYLMGGDWLFKLDKSGQGLRQAYMRQTSEAGWTKVSVPNAWNATDESAASYRGTVAWYRKDFTLPSSDKDTTWIVRFESVNYHARVFLNGKQIAEHDGAYVPWEVRLRDHLKRSGTNRLVVRVDNRRGPGDFPPYGESETTGNPTGGWWNYGGILREVYLRKVEKVDFTSVVVRPSVACVTCAATMSYSAQVRNYSAKAVRVNVRSRLGDQVVALGSKTIPAHGLATYEKEIRVAKPRVWSPATPYLYNTSFTASGGASQTFFLRSGIRSVTVVDGQLRLNGKKLTVRGFGMHEDSKDRGFAIDNATREKQIQMARVAGGTMLRAHYPLHPYYLERADELGMLIWNEVPVYSVRSNEFANTKVLDSAVKLAETAARTRQNNPSVIVNSIGNELNPQVGPYVGAYIKAAAEAVKRIDNSRPVALAINGYPGAGCQPEYAPLDLIGLNEYFGWYVGPGGQIADPFLLGSYLDQMRACYARKALVVTEFGAEANRVGPVEEKGTYAFQSDLIATHLAVFNTKPWLSGALYWALQEFRVRPNWEGGNPHPNSPLHEKGVVAFDGTLKPGYSVLQAIYKATTQVGAP
jgi:beta-glucuronidase